MTDRDENSLAGRVKRYAQVGTTVGGLAARLAGERYLGLEIDRKKHAEQLREALGTIKGPVMKVAQLLATIPDALPEDYGRELAQLQSNAPPMSWPFVRRRMGAELGSDWQTRFARFEREAAAAASLGQVHRAVAPDGRTLACKLQYPDMGSAVEADLQQLKLVFSLFQRTDPAIDTSQIHPELAARLREELDYRREAKATQLYRNMLAAEDKVHVAEVVPELSANRLLTMTWLEGEPLMPWLATDPGIEARNEVAYNLFRAWYVPFYFYGVIHGDPHLGNYTLRPDRSINLLDFGCIRIFPPLFVQGVIDLYTALDQKDEALAVQAYENWGFGNLSREVIEILNIWAGFLYGPLLEDRTRPIDDTGVKTYGREMAQKVHRELKRVGGIRPPREFVFMDRAAIGLGSVFMHLKAEINWHRLFQDLIGNFDPDILAARQDEALAAVSLDSPESGPESGPEPEKS